MTRLHATSARGSLRPGSREARPEYREAADRRRRQAHVVVGATSLLRPQSARDRAVLVLGTKAEIAASCSANQQRSFLTATAEANRGVLEW